MSRRGARETGRPDILERIVAHKRLEVEEACGRASEAHLRREAEMPGPRRDFFGRLSQPGPHGVNIISEIKRGSPSKGILREDLDAEATARAYERGGAAALSVLTDRSFFLGGPEDLRAARAAVALPVLRKDFIVSTYQIYESAVMGADAILLIVRVLTREFLKDALDLARELKIDVLVEVHALPELETATTAGARLIGINNRDLRTFRTDIQTSVDLARHRSPGQVLVAESGIHSRDQIERLLHAGIHNFLIGESLVRAENTEAFLASLLGMTMPKGGEVRA
ncbi:MAG: indole-3-glycerol phosphate synthase TrpC [Syntrophobacteraceae bacterium]|jgi:indole-3-glycerol phosphate synthase|nr:indole-3-glycerol phosphate synthase TrpC [Syntrophobacteraceae bacterium]